MDKPTFTKAKIRDLIKIARYNRLLEQGEQVTYFSRIIEAIKASNYSSLLTISYEFGLSLAAVNKALDRMARKVYRFDSMPLACELETLHILVGPNAKELELVELGGKKEPNDKQRRKLYFMITGSSNPGETMKFIRSLRLDMMYGKVWEWGLRKYLDTRYLVLKGPLDEEKSRLDIIRELGLPALFDEAMLIQRFTIQAGKPESGGKDLRDQLASENTLKAEALSKLNEVYNLLQESELNFGKLERAMADAGMDLEISNIEKAGIDEVRNYIRKYSVTGAREVANRYELVCPSVSNLDLIEAGRAIARSYFSQAQGTKKGRLFIRSEVLNNLKPFVSSGDCHRLPGGYMLALIRTIDGEEHYLICRLTAKAEQDAFNMRMLAYFFYYEAPQKAVFRLIKYYLDTQAGGIRTMRAIRKMLIAAPIVVSLAVLVSALYYIVLGVGGESFLVGAGITFIGMLIAAKNGYEEKIKPADHQKIPSYLSRKDGKVTATTSSLNFSDMSSENGDFPADDADGSHRPDPSESDSAKQS
ncbi:MAG: hypothetical protein FVQ81_01245 [Candidatus Glassbacteria bacterium]|nr:hypothetical protein [Candidatus Glassbacteria bacterium]